MSRSTGLLKWSVKICYAGCDGLCHKRTVLCFRLLISRVSLIRRFAVFNLPNCRRLSLSCFLLTLVSIAGSQDSIDVGWSKHGGKSCRGFNICLFSQDALLRIDVSSSFQLGAFFGGYFWFWLADHWSDVAQLGIVVSFVWWCITVRVSLAHTRWLLMGSRLPYRMFNDLTFLAVLFLATGSSSLLATGSSSICFMWNRITSGREFLFYFLLFILHTY